MTDAEKKELERLRAAEQSAASEKEKREKEAREREQMSMLGRIWDFVTDNFWLIALAVVAFVMIGPEKMKQLWDEGTKMLGGLLDEGIKLLPEEWQAGLNAMLGRDVSKALEGMDITQIRKQMLDQKIPAAIVNVLANNKETFQSFLNVAKEANGGKVSKDDFTNDKTVFALLTKKPEMARELAAAALKADGASANSPAAKEIKASLLAIVKDNRLDVLMNPPHLEHTKALFSMMPGITKEQVEAMTADGKNAPALRNILVAALSPAASAEEQNARIAAAAVEAVPTMTAESRKALIDAEMQVKPTDDAETKALKTNNGGKALAALRAGLGDEKLMQFVAIQKSGNDVAALKFALENRPAFEAFHGAAIVKDLGPKTQEAVNGLMSQPPAATAPLLAIIAKGVDPRQLKPIIFNEKGKMLPTAVLVDKFVNDSTARHTLEKAGTENLVALMKVHAGDKMPTALTPKNLSAILNAAQTIGSHERMKDENVRRDTVLVLNQFVTMAQSENPDVLGKLTNKEIAAFMNVKTNSAALKTLIEQTKDSLPKAKADKMSALVANWDIVSRLSGNEEGAAFLKDVMSLSKKWGSAEDRDSCKKPQQLSVGAEALIAWKSYGFSGKTFVGEHAEEFKQLALALKAAECSNLTALAPAATERNKQR